MRVLADQLRLRLDEAFKRCSLVRSDAEIQSDFARYLCVLTSGYVEQVVKALFQEFSRNRTDKRVLRHVNMGLLRFHNPTSDKIAELTGSFDDSWKDEFEKYIDGERKESLNSVVATRHLVAHGGSVGITYLQLAIHLQKIYEIVDWLSNRLSKSR
jgi:hypothetical protein